MPIYIIYSVLFLVMMERCAAARVTLLSVSDDDGLQANLFKCDDPNATRCCSASWKGKDGVARVSCGDLRGEELNWRCHCPKIAVAGKGLQSHKCEEPCSHWSRWNPSLETLSQADSCEPFAMTLVRAMELPKMFEPIPVEGSLLSSSARKHEWKHLAGMTLFNQSTKLRLLEDHSRLMISGLKYENVVSYRTFKFERKRLKQLKFVNESRNIIETSSVASVCSLSLGFMWGVQASRSLTRALALSKECGIASKGSMVIRDALVNMCFSSCIEQIRAQPWVPPVHGQPGVQCALPSDLNFAPIMAHEGCASVPSDTLLALVEWVFQVQCWEFHPPSVLWHHDDKALIPEGDDDRHHDVCTLVDKGKVARGGANVSCLEGSTCGCPTQAFMTTKTLEQIRASGHSAGARDIEKGVATKAAMMTVASHIGPLAPLALVGITINHVAKHHWAQMAGMVAGVGGGVVLTGVLWLPILLVAATLWALTAAVTDALADCHITMGCWPVDPVFDVDKRCEMSAEAKQGGSKVWFLPPPGTVIRPVKKGWSPEGKVLEDCDVDACDFDDYATQSIGYDGRMVKNCQPLPFTLMSPEQKSKFAVAFAQSCTGPDCTPRRKKEVAALSRQSTLDL